MDVIAVKSGMDVIAVKSELSPRRRSLGSAETDTLVPKCVKRRRRSPSVIALNDHHGGQQQQQSALKQLVDRSSTVAAATTTTTTTTTTTVKRSSRFRGVSRHRWTGRYEAHLWDKGSWNATQRKKGKQVYLGAYDEEESAARAYDLAAIKYWGTTTFTNFPVSDYVKEVEIMENVTKEEYLATLRRKSSGFSRGVSKYRGVARHHHNGRWEARIGRVFGNKYLYLGTYSTQEEAAHAYDIAAIEYRGINAVTNFDLSTYIRWLRSSGANSVPPDQDPMIFSSNSHQPLQTTPQPVNPVEETQFPFNSNPFPMGIPQNQHLVETKMPLSPSNQSSAPTALGLLLRSSMFKELVEKNLSAADEQDIEEKGTKNNLSKTHEGNEFRGIFFNGMCPSKVENLTGLDLEDKNENELPLFSSATTTRQTLWNGSSKNEHVIH